MRKSRSLAVAEENAAAARAEEKAAFLLRLRSGGIRDLDLLRALEKVPREMFVPHRFVDLARRDLVLPIGCGQTLSEPSLVARMIAALAIEHGAVLASTDQDFRRFPELRWVNPLA